MRPITGICTGEQKVKDGDGLAHDLELSILKQLEAVQEQALEVTMLRIKAFCGLPNVDFESEPKVSS